MNSTKFAAVVLIALMTAACITPDVHVSCRKALLDNSLKAVITNTGDKPLFEVNVSTQRWDGKYRVTSILKPNDSTTAGWLELPTGLGAGDTVEVYAEGFPLPYQFTCPGR
jgi:hypothetical protein